MTKQTPLQMPGATLITRLKVYDTTAPDGQIGGTPHVHLICSEVYVVLAGSGAVEMIDKHGYSRVELNTHDALLFSPGTIHRLINPNQDLEILVIMQNSGLPERGDNVVSFTQEWLTTDEAYTKAMHITKLDEAYQRRDRGVVGFVELKTAFDHSLERGQAALKQFYEYAHARTTHHHQQWRETVVAGAQSTVVESLHQIDQLQQGDTSYLQQSANTHVRTTGEPAIGFCGHLNRYFDPMTLALEGYTEK